MIRWLQTYLVKLTGYQRGVSVFVERFLQILYVLSTVGLAIVGFNTLVLAVLYWVHRREDPAHSEAALQHAAVLAPDDRARIG